MLNIAKDLTLTCDQCGATIVAIDISTPIPHFPLPLSAVKPLIKTATDSVAPALKGCKLICAECNTATVDALEAYRKSFNEAVVGHNL